MECWDRWFGALQERWGRRRGVSLYVRECLDCRELSGGDERVECLLVSQGKGGKAGVIVRIYNTPSNQHEEVDEKLYKQLEVS